jgi:hypothetical protein
MRSLDPSCLKGTDRLGVSFRPTSDARRSAATRLEGSLGLLEQLLALGWTGVGPQ